MDIPSEAEMADRLAKLKGTTPGSTKMTGVAIDAATSFKSPRDLKQNGTQENTFWHSLVYMPFHMVGSMLLPVSSF